MVNCQGFSEYLTIRDSYCYWPARYFQNDAM